MMNQTLFNYPHDAQGNILTECGVWHTNNVTEPNSVQHAIIKMPRLHLNLHARWFDMIASGRKPVEYRAIGGHWDKVFVYPNSNEGKIKIAGKLYQPDEIVICFSNGYSKTRRQMLVACKGLTKGPGNPQWGAEPSRAYHCLELGGIVELPLVGVKPTKDTTTQSKCQFKEMEHNYGMIANVCVVCGSVEGEPCFCQCNVV